MTMKIKNKDKKKNQDMKKQDMPEFKFKQFTAEEDRIYAETVGKFREAVSQGKTLRQAYESCPVADKELETLIQADFLKIMIAERHFAQRQPLEDLAKAFDVSLELLKNTLARMLQEVGITASQQSGAETKTND
jgi:hypothetical protein